jgi:large subunit ribosomal protein L3
MTKFILGKKVNMVQYFEKDGYNAIQVGYEEQKKERATKPHIGHIALSQKDQEGKTGAYKHLYEFRNENTDLNIGDTITIEKFEKGDVVVVSGISKGKGFQGVVKRHGFKGGRRTHGQKHSEREPGSIGIGGIQRVFKGTRMAGRMGGDRITVKNLKVVSVDKENNQILIKGAIPGRRGTLIEIISK